MNIRLLNTIAALLLAFVYSVSSQTTRLTLDDAVKIAIENNPQLKIARLEMDKADYQVYEAIGTALPNISTSGTYTHALKKPVFFLPIDFQDPSKGSRPVALGDDNSVQFGFQANQPLFNFAVFTGVGTAKIYQRASREMFRSAFNTTVSNVKRAFYGVLFIKKVYEMMLASMKNAEDNFRNVEVLYKQGLVSEYDLIRAQVQVENTRPSVVEAERSALVASNALKVLLGISPEKDISVSGELTYESVDPAVLRSADETVLQNNAGLQALELQSQVREQMVKIYRSESLPVLSAFGNHQWQAQKNTLDFSTNDFVRSSQIGLSLNLNLFNGLQTNARVNQAEVDFMKSQEQHKSTSDALLTQVQNIRLRLEEAQKRIKAQGLTVEQAEKGYKIATTRYTAGAGTQLEVNDADLALMRARVNRVQAIYDHIIARTDLEEILCLVQIPQ